MARVIGTATINIKADPSRLYSDLRGIERRGGSAFNVLRGGALRAGTAMVGLSSAVAAIGLGRLASEAVQFGANYRIQLDNAAAAVRGLVTEEDEANRLLQEMTQFAINTPFKLPGVQDATAQLLAVGDGFGVTSENVLEYVETYGNAIAITGGSEDTLRRVVRNFGQMSSKGKVLGRDMNDLGNAIPGFDAWQVLADGAGVSVKELRRLQDLGKLDELLTGDEAVGILTEGLKEMDGAAGAMERKMNTLGGTIEFFKDTIGIALADGLNPFFEALQSLLKDPAILASLEGLIEAFSGLAEELISSLAPVLPDIIDAFSAILEAITPIMPIVGVLAGVFADLAAVAAPIFEKLAEAVQRILPAVEQLFDAFMPIVDVIGDLLVAAIEVLLTLLEPLLPVFTDLVDILADSLAAILPDIVDAFLALAEALAPLMEELGVQFVDALLQIVPLLPALSEAFLAMVEALIPLLPLVLQLATIMNDTMLLALVAITPLIIEIIDSFVLWMEELEKVTTDIGNFMDDILAEWDELYEGTIGAVQEIVEGVIEWFEDLFDTLVGNSIIPDLVDRIIYYWDLLFAGIEAVVTAIASVVTTVWNGISATVTTIVNGIASVVRSVFNGLKAFAQDAWDAIRRNIVDPIIRAKDKVAEVVTNIKNKAVETFESAKNRVTDIWNSVKNAITGPIQAAYDFVADKVNGIKNLVQGALDKISSIPGAGLVGGALGFASGLFAEGGIINRPTIAVMGEGNRSEAIVPLSDPYRAMQVMQQAGLDRLAANMGKRDYSGPLVSMPGAVIQDATDADLVAQRTLVAMQAAMVA